MSQSNQTPTPDTTLAAGFRAQIPGIVLTILIAFATSYLNSQRTQNDLAHRVETAEKQTQTNAQNISQNSMVLQQNAIRLAEMNVIQANTLETIKDLKMEQTEIKQMLQKK